jgi:hypothetical protein
MNPYQSRPHDQVNADMPPPVDADELRKKQMRLVIRLAVLAAVTTAISLAAIVLVGFQMMPIALVIALVLGIFFTVAAK